MNDAPEWVPPRRSPREVNGDWVRALTALQALADRPATLAGCIAQMPDGAAPALIGAAGALSYAALSGRANQVARFALAQRLAAGNVVALLMPNRPDYVAIWLGLGQVGCVTALLNTNLSAAALAHGIASAGAGHVIVDAAFAQVVTELHLPPHVNIWAFGDIVGLPRVDAALDEQDDGPLTPAEAQPPASEDTALLIYTSGTTGLPKAARVTHARVLSWSAWFAGLMDARPADRMYDCLPLYHSVGGVVAVGSMLLAGGAVVLREKFSARRFWDDVVEGRCTIVQYIGELCRYLLQAPPHPQERAHGLRLVCGNGLREEIWAPFQARFRIPRILEFYAATEGNVSLVNCEGKPGAIGRVPPFLAHRFPVALIRCDAESGMPLRGEDGFCLRCAPEEAGEAIGPIGGAALRRFDGYTDDMATAKKILRDVFAPGDAWFRTGDLMRRDRNGYYKFVDRLGDTFRWKGENVSTTEVAAVLSGCPGVIEAVVYGVAVPGAEGKAGMAALVVGEGFDLAAARAAWRARLPSYACPLFVRLGSEIETTGTFKLTKTALAREGLMTGSDPLWFDDQAVLVPMTAALRVRLAAGALRL